MLVHLLHLLFKQSIVTIQHWRAHGLSALHLTRQ